MVIPYDFSDWQHASVVYEENTIRLYINGCFYKECSPKKSRRIFPSLNLGGHEFRHAGSGVAAGRMFISTDAEMLYPPHYIEEADGAAIYKFSLCMVESEYQQCVDIQTIV